MKYKLASYFCILILIISACTGKGRKGGAISGDQPADTGNAVITFAEYEHNFGIVKEGEKIGCIFSYTNTGKSALIIHSATTSCGCTVSKYNSRPINPGKSGTLEVVFDTEGRSGLQSKTITVNSNAVTPVVLLKITAEINSNNK